MSVATKLSTCAGPCLTVRIGLLMTFLQKYCSPADNTCVYSVDIRLILSLYLRYITALRYIDRH